MVDLMRRMPPDPNYPMTPAEEEASRRMIADARFREGAPVAANLAFEATGLPMMHRGVGNVSEGVQGGNLMQTLGGTGQVALGALPYGADKLIGGLIPFGAKAAEYAANLPGVRGFLARNVPAAAGTVGGTELTQRALSAGQAHAAGLPPPPATQDTKELQSFLQSQGYPIKVDGQMGPNTRRALSDYGQKYQAQEAAKNTPERRAAETARMAAEAQKMQAEARALQGQEAARRAGVLTEAEARYDERPENLGQWVTEEAQNWVGPAIMGAGALFGSKGITKAPAQRAATEQLNKLATSLGKQKTPLTPAQKKGFVDTYGQTVRGTPIRDAAGTTAAYGALGGEMALSQKYLDDARGQYDKALAEYEGAAAGGNLEGGRERELADAVIKAKRDVEKWEGLQGAGLHAMGYMTAGKLGTAMLPKGKVSAEARQLRNQLRREVSDPASGLLPKARPSSGRVQRKRFTQKDDASIRDEFAKKGKITPARMKKITEKMSPAAKKKAQGLLDELTGGQ